MEKPSKRVYSIVMIAANLSFISISAASLAVDQAAANRFIRAAIVGVKAKTKATTPSGSSSTNASNASDTIAPLDKNLKFLESKPERAELSSGDESSDEEGLQIFGENEDVDSTQKAADSTPPQPGKKRKTMDVFAGLCIVSLFRRRYALLILRFLPLRL